MYSCLRLLPLGKQRRSWPTGEQRRSLTCARVTLVYGSERRGSYRRYTITRVLDHWATIKPAYRITLEDGTELVASGDHRFLSSQGWKFVEGTEQERRTHDYERQADGKRMAALARSFGRVPAVAMCGSSAATATWAHTHTSVPDGACSDVHRFRLALVDMEALRRARDCLSAVDVVTRVRVRGGERRASADRRHPNVRSRQSRGGARRSGGPDTRPTTGSRAFWPGSSTPRDLSEAWCGSRIPIRRSSTGLGTACGDSASSTSSSAGDCPTGCRTSDHRRLDAGAALLPHRRPCDHAEALDRRHRHQERCAAGCRIDRAPSEEHAPLRHHDGER